MFKFHTARPLPFGLRYRRPAQRFSTAAVVTALLAACGGGGSESASAPATLIAPVTPVVPAPPPAAPTSAVPNGYTLVWSDEFNTDGLPDASRWDYDTGRNREGWFNNERQYYAAARTENSVVSNGKLRITAKLEELRSAADWGGQRYTSARLLTRGKASWTYGFFEVRAKLPCGRGSWPAIWLLSTSGVWPDGGEIDIMEQVGSDPSRVFGTVHTKVSGGPGTGSAVQVPDACTAFHDYQLTWTVNELAIGVDGVVYYRYANPRSGTTTWPFDAPQFMILNVAVGGDLGGSIDDTAFPIAMEIEHVRVYQAPR
jgi:beta-glucanase (GH16 family)